MVTEVEVNEKNREALIAILNNLKELLNVNVVDEDIKIELIGIREEILIDATIKKYFIEEYSKLKKDQKINLKWFIDKNQEYKSNKEELEKEPSRWL